MHLFPISVLLKAQIRKLNLNAKINSFQKDGPDFFPIESKNGILGEKRTQNFQLIEVTSILGFLQKEFFLQVPQELGGNMQEPSCPITFPLAMTRIINRNNTFRIHLCSKDIIMKYLLICHYLFAFLYCNLTKDIAHNYDA